MCCGIKDSCQNLFLKNLKFCHLCQNIYILLIFVVNNRDQFLIHLELHNINTRHSSNLLVPLANSDTYQRGVCYSGIKIFNRLPFNIKNISDNPKTIKWFKNVYI
jgi:hypothetical protein